MGRDPLPPRLGLGLMEGGVEGAPWLGLGWMEGDVEGDPPSFRNWVWGQGRETRYDPRQPFGHRRCCHGPGRSKCPSYPTSFTQECETLGTS